MLRRLGGGLRFARPPPPVQSFYLRSSPLLRLAPPVMHLVPRAPATAAPVSRGPAARKGPVSFLRTVEGLAGRGSGVYRAGPRVMSPYQATASSPVLSVSVMIATAPRSGGSFPNSAR